MSKSEKKERIRKLIDEKRHAQSNIPMSASEVCPEDAYEIVPGIFVASQASLPKLIEFFNVTHIVRCVEYDPLPEEALTEIGGDAQHPYGEHVPYPRNVFHAKIRDTTEETEFAEWAMKASDFIENMTTVEDPEEMMNAFGFSTEKNNEEGEEEGEKENDDDEEENKNNNASAAATTAENPQEAAAKIASAAAASAVEHSEEKHSSECECCSHNNNNNKKEEEEKEKEEQQENNNKKQEMQQQQQVEQEQQEQEESSYPQKVPGAIALHCDKGRSRSPAVAIAYLMLKRQMTLQDALDMFAGDEDSNLPEYKLQLNPIFIRDLARLEANIHGDAIFDLNAYWVERLQELFPRVPQQAIIQQLEVAGGNMLEARSKLMAMSARQFFDRDKLMIDALFDVVVKTIDDWKHDPEAIVPSRQDDIITKEEVTKLYHENGKKRDVALMKATQLIKKRLFS